MRTLLFTTIAILIGSFSYAQKTSQSIGLKAGDPVGVTYKQYVGNGMAWEAVIGSFPRGLYNNYYKDAFYDEYNGVQYRGHNVDMALALQARIMWQYSLEEYIPDSEWYWGVGGNLRVAHVDYRYTVIDPAFGGSIDGDDTNIDFGPEVFAGAEYFVQEVPLTAFIELGMMVEILDEVGVRLLGGGGVRYNF